MAKKKDPNEEPAGAPLVEAAKTIGKAAGKVVAAVEGVMQKSSKIPKLAKKNKPRLPRREKKARQKAHADTAQRKAARRKQSAQ